MIVDPAPVVHPAHSPEDVVRAVKHLASAPKVLPRLKRLLSDGNSSIQDIVALVRLDMGIAARVLKVANSVYFSKGVRSLTIGAAVERVGYNQIYEVVSYSVASQVIVRPLQTYGIDANEAWKNSVIVALAAEALAMRLGQDRDVAYTIGLLHCIGRVAIDDWATSTGQKIQLRSAGFPHDTSIAERAALGFTQADTGELLLRDWDFPDVMIGPVRWQYTPRETAEHGQMAGLLRAAKWIRSMIGASSEPFNPVALEPWQRQQLRLDSAALTGIVAQVTARLAEVDSLLNAGDEIAVDRQSFPSQKWGR